MSVAQNQITVVPLSVSYKGSRNYVHGTSVYEKISAYIESSLPEHSVGSFRMVIHDFAVKQCELHYVIDPMILKKPEHGCIEISTSTGIRGWLVESDDEIIDRIPFPEEVICAKCKIGEEASVSVSSNMPFQPIEILVAMTKHLHISKYSEDNGKWVFVRLELDRLLREEDASHMCVRIEQNIGTRLTKSLVLSGNEKIGEIYFSMVTEWPE